MALTMNKLIGSSTTTTALFTTTTTKTTTTTTTSPPPSVSFASKRPSHVIVSATGKFTPRTGKFDSKNRRGGSASTTTTTTTKDELTRNEDRVENMNNKSFDNIGSSSSNVAAEDVVVYADDGFVRPELPGDKPDFWEGPQWDALGFFVQYMWAFGVVFALAACGVAVVTYNEGASDFKETPAYKESIQSQDLLEGPEASNSDVFESNPTEEAPALE